jgi:hypothetical protein
MNDTKEIDVNEKIQLIMRQTDLSKDEIIQKLKEFNDDHILVIKAYFGIKPTPHKEVTSINQEIYKQLRHKLQIH